MYFKGVVTELLWFLRGDSDIRFLWENNCSIWDGDWYKKYKTTCSEPYTLEEVKQKVKGGNHNFHDSMFDMGPIYGKQWRSWSGFQQYESEKTIDTYQIDQISDLIKQLKENPDSRRLLVSAWNPADLEASVLPPCHYGFQVYTRELDIEYRAMLSGEFNENTLRVDQFIEMYGMRLLEQKLDEYNIPKRAISLQWSQRSCDFFLGIPFNIASYGLLLEIIAKSVNMVPDELIGNLGDTHLYLNHIEQAKEQIGTKLTHEERQEMLKEAMEPLRYQSAVDEQVPFGGGLSEYYDIYKIPYRTREPYPLPILKHMKTDDFYKSLSEDLSLLTHLDNTDFVIEGYHSHPTIKAKLSN
jgi:thymidylate synthase